jgi:uncharacterized radical SAM superfamily protein
MDNLASLPNDSNLDGKVKHAREQSWKYFGKKLTAYYPSNQFPTISITGSSCDQNCLYCDKQYLKNMKEITTPEKLRIYAKKLVKKGGTGFLISGGFTKEAILPIEPFLDVIREIKETTQLKINLHPGLVNKNQAKAIAEAKIDTISFDLVTDDQVINEILQNNFKGKDYITSLDAMNSVGLTVIPHICLGLYYGSMRGNIEAIDAAIKYNPKLVVFLGLIPTKKTPMENSKTINPDDFQKVIVYTRLQQPKIQLSLGCMRVRLSIYEKKAIEAGINRIAVPKISSLSYAFEEFGISIEKINSCCSI